MKLGSTIFAITIVALFSACSSGSDDENSNDESQNELVGSWKLECHSRSENPFYYTVTELEVSNGIFEINGTNYDDPDCTVPASSDIDDTFSIIHEYTIGQDIETTSGVTAKELDLHNIERDGEPEDINFYTIIYVDGDTLYLGNEEGDLDASSPSLRPNSLDFDFPYFKQ